VLLSTVKGNYSIPIFSVNGAMDANRSACCSPKLRKALNLARATMLQASPDAIHLGGDLHSLKKGLIQAGERTGIWTRMHRNWKAAQTKTENTIWMARPSSLGDAHSEGYPSLATPRADLALDVRAPQLKKL